MFKISIIVGVVCLCFIGNIRTDHIKTRSRLTTLFACFLLSLLLGAFLVRSSLDVLGYDDAAESRSLVKGLLSQARSIPTSVVNIILIDGASGSARGLDGDLLARTLTAKGYPTAVLQVSLAGATHLERYEIHKAFWSHLTQSQQAMIASKTCLFLQEYNPTYDKEPLNGFEKNETSDRTLSYMTIANAWAGYLARRSLDRESESREKQLDLKTGWDLVTCALINFFQVGRVNRIMPIADLPTMPGFTPLAEPSANYTGNQAILKALGEFKAKQDHKPAENHAWISNIRDKRLHELYGDVFNDRIGFLPPCINAVYLRKAHAMAEAALVPFIIPDETLYTLLDSPDCWYDKGHLLKHGAEVYSVWLAGRLIETGKLSKAVTPSS